MTRVAIVAGSPVLRAGLEALLAGTAAGIAAGPTAIVVVGALAEPQAGERVSLGELVAPLDPDVVVWVPDESPDADREWLMPLRADDGPPPADLATERGGRRGRAAVVMLTQRLGARAAIAALRAGARAVVAREAGADEIMAAIEGAAAGLVVMPVDVADELLAEAGELAPPSAPALPAGTGAPLTAREREVLALLALGLANKAIAPRLGISEHTVKAHVASIFEKLHVGTRAEAVVTAARTGLLLL
jgi:DNA-binding NarL/FixJ family response regulator